MPASIPWWHHFFPGQNLGLRSCFSLFFLLMQFGMVSVQVGTAFTYHPFVAGWVSGSFLLLPLLPSSFPAGEKTNPDLLSDPPPLSLDPCLQKGTLTFFFTCVTLSIQPLIFFVSGDCTTFLSLANSTTSFLLDGMNETRTGKKYWLFFCR